MSNGGGSDTRITDVGNLLGLFLAGVAGVFGFVGLSGDEVGSILRNEQASPTTWVLILVTLTAVIGVVSIFTAQRLERLFAACLLLAATATLPLTFLIVPIDATTDVARAAAWATFVIVASAAITTAVLAVLRQRHAASTPTVGFSYLRAQPVLLLVAVILLASAITAGVRVEVRSQAATTHVQLEPHFRRTEAGTTLKLSIAASKLAADEVVAVSVYAVPTVAEVDATLSQPCREIRCHFVAGFLLNADTSGNVDDTVDIAIDDTKYQHLAFSALPCSKDGGTVAGVKCTQASEEQYTRVDVRLVARPPDREGATLPMADP